MTPKENLLRLIIETLSANFATCKVYGSEFAMEPGDQLVGYRVKHNLPELWVRLDVSTASARPPFEWCGEITLDGPRGLEHWLIRETDVVRAQRKDLTPLSSNEIDGVITIMLSVQAKLADADLWHPGATTMNLT